ncbi:MAG: holo-ACP synthase [Gemmatimonadota bacterium]
MTAAALTVGIDLVQVSRIAESLDRFGDRFLKRIFTEGEIAYARAEPEQTAERLAARFAAKEATIKAMGLAEQPFNWRDIEVRRTSSGACEIDLHGSVGAFASSSGAGPLIVSLSHEGDYATAVVISCGPRIQDT